MRRLVMSMLCLLLAAPASADEEGIWRLAFEDDFDREKPGPDWLEADNIAIVDGWLHLKGRCDAELNRAFAPDVKVEFLAMADPARPPCDLSVLLAGQHLLAFGGGNNRFHQIVFGGARARDLDPAFLIEPGKKYKLVAVKEGPRLAYYANDTLLVEATVDDPLGGPGFDRIALVTWNGMLVDYVKVYERATPAPGGPILIDRMPEFGFDWDNRTLSYKGDAALPTAVAEGMAEYNGRAYGRAIGLLEGVSPPTLLSVVALGYVVGDVACEETPEMQQRLAALARRMADEHPDNQAAADFAAVTEWFSRITIVSRDHRATRRILNLGQDNNPYYYKARLFEARYNFAHAIEGARSEGQQAAVGEFAELKKIWPEHRALREWTGEQIVWGEELIHDEQDGPAWARYLNEAFVRQQRILEWWFTERQAPDGSLGGGWGDDVELLRSWVPVACITTAGETTIAGIEKLAQGVWDKVLSEGYDRSAGDVEHSAEPSCDSLPTMILLRYGDPKWVEYNLRSAKTVRERFMGIDDRGFLHFKSTEFGMEGVNLQPQSGGDTGYHARAMKHFIWLAWYGLPEARQTYLDWCNGWLDVTMRQIDTKPAGFVPATVWYPSGEIAPPTGDPWYDPEYNYYGFPGLPGMIHDSFLTAYLFSEDYRYLEAIQTMMDMATLGPLHRGDSSLPPDHIENLLAKVAHQADHNVTAVYKWFTGQRVYDEYTLRFGTPTQRYMIDYDVEQYMKSFEAMAKGLRTNWTLRTSEVLQTDRAGLAGSSEVLGAYTGAVRNFRDSGAPTLTVTYDTPDLNFAAMVTETTPDRVRVMLYNFNGETTRIGVRPWRLVPGTYVLNMGEPVAGERAFQKRYAWTGPIEVHHQHRGTPIWIDVPSGKEWVVDLRLRTADYAPKLVADLAIARRDVWRHGEQVGVKVHNIGPDLADGFDVVVEVPEGEGFKAVARTTVGGMPASEEFNPVTRTVSLTLPEGAAQGAWRVRLDPDDRIGELYELNNVVTFASK